MRIGYISDTHFEFQNRNVSKFLDNLLSDQNLDALLFAGDVSTLDDKAQSRFVINTINALYLARVRTECPIFSVNGNHEFYGLDMKKYDPYNHHADHPNSIYHGGNFMVSLKANIVVIGCTLWTDYCLMGKSRQLDAMEECNSMSDSRLIKVNGERFTSEKALALHIKDKEFLINSLSYCKSKNLKPIILTHHVPHSVARNHKFPVDLMSAGFYSDLDDVIELAEKAGCKGWIFGHHHWCIEDRTTFKFPLLSQQAGYVKESINWDGKIGILEV